MNNFSNYMSKILNEKNWYWSITLFPLVGLVIFIALGEYFFPINHPHRLGIFDRISDLNSASLIILTLFLVWATFALAWIGYVQIDKLNKTSRNDFLLRIDNRYGSKSIIKARRIIHDLYIDTYSNDICLTTHILKISEKIKLMDNNKNESKNFIYLLNFVDFLETVAYFTNHESIQPDELKELLGESFVFYYKVFSEWIDYRRRKFDNKEYYRELQTVAEKLERES